MTGGWGLDRTAECLSLQVCKGTVGRGTRSRRARALHSQDLRTRGGPTNASLGKHSSKTNPTDFPRAPRRSVGGAGLVESTRRPAAHVAPGSAQWPRATPGARVWAPRRSYSFALRVVNKSMVAASTLLCLLAIRTLERRETQKHLRITENNNGDRKKKKSVRKKNTPLPPTNLTAASRGRAAPAQARAHWLARRGRGAPIGRAACQSGAGRGARAAAGGEPVRSS